MRIINAIIVIIFIFSTIGYSQESIVVKPKLSKQQVDSLYAVSEHKIDSITSKVNKTLDSLGKIDISPEKYVMKADSTLQSLQQRMVRTVKHAHDSIKGRLFGKLATLDSVVSAKRKKIDSLSQVLGLGDRIKMPENFNLDIPSISQFDKLSLPYKSFNLNSVTEKIKLDNPFSSLSNFDSKVNLSSLDLGLKKLKLPQLPSEFNELKQHFEKLKSYSVKSISKEDMVKASQKIIEREAMKLKEVAGMQSNLKEVEKVKEMVAQATQNLQQGPDGAKEKAKEEFVDYLKGHEEKVQKDIEDIGKLQLKYRNVADVRLLPKRPPNEMKGKPFVERLIPAITLQTYIKTNTGIDIAPSVGYRISGRLRAGFGGFRRIVFNKTNNSVSNTTISGMRAFNEFRFWKSNYVHLELEHSNGAEVNPYAVDQEGKFINKVNFGLYRTYRITKYINGHALFLYDLKQISNFPNTSHSSMRFGIDVQIVKKKKKH